MLTEAQSMQHYHYDELCNSRQELALAESSEESLRRGHERQRQDDAREHQDHTHEISRQVRGDYEQELNRLRHACKDKDVSLHSSGLELWKKRV